MDYYMGTIIVKLQEQEIVYMNYHTRAFSILIFFKEISDKPLSGDTFILILFTYK